MNELEHALLRDGTSIVLRDVVPDDRTELTALFGRMSSLSRHHRYFGALAEPDLRWLDRMTDSDIAVVAVDAERIVGLGRCVTIAPQIAELAFEVGDKDQHRGIGTLLLEYMARIARTRDISAFRADVEADNKDMLEVFENSGFVLRANADRDGYHVVFPIDDTERYAHAVAERGRIALRASRKHDD